MSSAADTSVVVEKLTFSPYQLLPFKKNWYKSLQKKADVAFNPEVQLFLTKTGVSFSSEIIALPESSAYPHVYFISIDSSESPVIDTVF